MTFADKFAQFDIRNLVGWCVIIGLFAAWEIWGCTHNSDATFTYLLRTTCAAWKYGLACMVIAYLAIGWHFLWTPLVEWVKSVV